MQPGIVELVVLWWVPNKRAGDLVLFLNRLRDRVRLRNALASYTQPGDSPPLPIRRFGLPGDRYFYETVTVFVTLKNLFTITCGLRIRLADCSLFTTDTQRIPIHVFS